jgi:hypothetical protein
MAANSIRSASQHIDYVTRKLEGELAASLEELNRQKEFLNTISAMTASEYREKSMRVLTHRLYENKKVLSDANLPRSEYQHVKKILTKEVVDLKGMEEIGKRYIERMKERDETKADIYRLLAKEPSNRNQEGPAYKSLDRKLKKLEDEVARDGYVLFNISKRFAESEIAFQTSINHYKNKDQKKKAEGMVGAIVGAIALAGGSIIYGLSKGTDIGPASTGYFIGAASPSVLAMLTAVIIFLAFFLINQRMKLRQ